MLTETEVETSVDNDTDDRGDETSVKTGDTVGSEGLLVDIDQTVELTRTTLLGGLVVVGETGTGVVERVDEEKRRSTSGTTLNPLLALTPLNEGKTYGSDVTGEPLPVTLRLLEAEHGLEVVLEGEVKSLSREVSDDVGGVTSPERGKTLVLVGPGEAVADTLVRGSKTALLDPGRGSAGSLDLN